MGKKVDLNAKSSVSSVLPKKAHPVSFAANAIKDMSQKPKETKQTLIQDTISSDTKSAINDETSDEIDRVLGAISKIGTTIALKTMLVPMLLIIVGFLIIATLVIIISIIVGSSVTGGVATGGYYATRCPEVTVIMTDKSNNYQKTGTKTYSLDDYVAGVVAAEVGGFNNLEIYKVFAIAARTYLYNNDRNCTIESSDRKQVFRDITSSRNSGGALIYRAVSETSGQVLLSGSGLYGVEYDAFCSIGVDSNYYTLKQQNQKIPRSWVDRQSGIDPTWKQGNCAGNHGRGISQWGSYYLVTQQGYNHEAIFAYYLGTKNVAISSGGAVSSIPGLVVRDTTNSNELHMPLSTALQKSGSSIGTLNSYIRDNVRKNGAGTREGVVTAAVSLVNYLYDVPRVRIPYYWGGAYQQIGVNPNFGAKVAASTSKNGATYNYSGFDCSGFVSWAIKNGGYNLPRYSTQAFNNSFSGNSCNITSSSCKGNVGDLINSASCHVQLIVAVDEKSGMYYVAESTGDYGVIVRPWSMHSGNCGSATTKILHMDSYYNNPNNVNKSY